MLYQTATRGVMGDAGSSPARAATFLKPYGLMVLTPSLKITHCVKRRRHEDSVRLNSNLKFVGPRINPTEGGREAMSASLPFFSRRLT